MKTIIITTISLLIASMSYAQLDWRKGGNDGTGGTQTTIGTNSFWNEPFQLMTQGQIRMHINQTGTFAVGTNSSGFIGIGTNNPYSPLHVVGNQITNAQGWKRGITLSNAAALQWDGGGGNGFFMAHPSTTPYGNWYSGLNFGPTPGAAVEYSSSVYVNSGLNGNPLGSTQFFKHVLVLETGFERRLGVNVSYPNRVTEVKSNLTTDPQFRVTTINNAWAEFQTLTTGNLLLIPQSGRVGVNVPAGTNPSHNLEVNGNVRIRNTPVGTPNCILVGTNQTGAADNQVNRLDFTGNANQVLLGNGTWGTASGNISANNGTSMNPANTVVRLGDQYSIFPIPTQTNSPLLQDRQVRLNGNDFVFSGNGNVAIGLNWPLQPTERLDVNGNGRFRTVPVQGGQSLILGVQQGATVDDIELSRLEFSGIATDVLLGNGTFGPAPGGGVAITADNGLTINPANNVQLGQVNSGAGVLNGGELIHDTEIPMNGFNMSLYGSGTIGVDRFSIGQAAANSVKSYVFNNIESNGFYSYLDANNVTFEVTSWGARLKTAVYGNGFDNTGSIGVVVGVVGEATSDFGAVGVYARSAGAANTVYGVRSRADGTGDNNIGGEFSAYGASSLVNYGIWAEATGAPTNYAGYFNGDVYIAGSYGPSDENLKNNITPLNNAMNLINQLEPKTFEYDQVGYPSMNLSDGLQYGLIAQEVEQILPELVSDNIHAAKYDSLGNILYAEVQFKGLNYEQLIPIMIKGMQEQQSDIDSLTITNITNTNYSDSLELVVINLNDRLTLLENCLSNILPALCQANSMAIQSTPDEVQEKMNSIIDVELSDRNNIVLNQNVPNPFAERTVISYTIPETVIKAQIHFYNGQGTLINSVDVIDRGNGELNVYANDLSSGVYTYSLVADGKTVATKRMVKH